MKKKKTILLISKCVLVVLILFGAFFGGLFVGNLYKVANKGESVNALSNEDDYPIFDGKDVYEYWRGTLNEDEQILYDEIKEAYLQFKKEFTTRLNSLTESQMRKVYLLVKLDHPEIFWVNTYSTAQTFLGNVDTSSEIVLYYTYSEEEAKEIKARIEKNYSKIIEEAKKQENDFQKIKFVHDKLIEISVYRDFTDEEISSFQNMVSIFDTGESVCAGYAYGFKFIMDQLGIKSLASVDIGNEDSAKNHIWNMVYLYGKWYNIDVTWDDEVQEGEIRYKHFLKSNEEFYQDHHMQEGIPQT